MSFKRWFVTVLKKGDIPGYAGSHSGKLQGHQEMGERGKWWVKGLDCGLCKKVGPDG